MRKTSAVTCLFVDIGGVLLTNGWDHHARRRAARNFKLDLAEFEDRHHLTFDTFEEGKITLNDYLGRVVFHQKRTFTRAAFRQFMFAQSKPFIPMLALLRSLKERYGLKVAAVSNEGRELNAYRIKKFELNRIIDSFISSSFVHIRKPDTDIFKLALDIVQVHASQVLYLENTPMFAQVAESLGIRGILHTDYISTCEKLSALGLPTDEGTRHGSR
jgi:FMN phosphatase YigB (HAD superfamily)